MSSAGAAHTNPCSQPSFPGGASGQLFVSFLDTAGMKLLLSWTMKDLKGLFSKPSVRPQINEQRSCCSCSCSAWSRSLGDLPRLVLGLEWMLLILFLSCGQDEQALGLLGNKKKQLWLNSSFRYSIAGLSVTFWGVFFGCERSCSFKLYWGGD